MSCLDINFQRIIHRKGSPGRWPSTFSFHLKIIGTELSIENVSQSSVDWFTNISREQSTTKLVNYVGSSFHRVIPLIAGLYVLCGLSGIMISLWRWFIIEDIFRMFVARLIINNVFRVKRKIRSISCTFYWRNLLIFHIPAIVCVLFCFLWTHLGIRIGLLEKCSNGGHAFVRFVKIWDHFHHFITFLWTKHNIPNPKKEASSILPLGAMQSTKDSKNYSSISNAALILATSNRRFRGNDGALSLSALKIWRGDGNIM